MSDSDAPVAPPDAWVDPMLERVRDHLLLCAIMPRHGAGRLELLFVCDFDPTEDVLTSAKLIGVGTANRLIVNTGNDAAPGQVILHSHPGTEPLTPSETDVRTATRLHLLNIGSAVCSADCRRVIMLRRPGTGGAITAAYLKNEISANTLVGAESLELE